MSFDTFWNTLFLKCSVENSCSWYLMSVFAHLLKLSLNWTVHNINTSMWTRARPVDLKMTLFTIFSQLVMANHWYGCSPFPIQFVFSWFRPICFKKYNSNPVNTSNIGNFPDILWLVAFYFHHLIHEVITLRGLGFS